MKTLSIHTVINKDKNIHIDLPVPDLAPGPVDIDLNIRPRNEKKDESNMIIKRMAGSISNEDADIMLKAVEECRKVDTNGW